MNSSQCGAPIAAIRSRASETSFAYSPAVELAAHQAEPQVDEVRVHHVGLAIAAHVVELARDDGRMHLAAVHPELAGKAAEPRHRVEAGAWRAAGTSRARP